jgi:mono/diheme cytochrome c family protein
MRSIVLVLFVLQIILPDLKGQDWIVPDDKKGKLSTFPFDDNTRKAGERLYTINCQSCHGTPGKANFLNLVPPPGDPATDKVQHNNDGEIFYKVTTGRGQMPSFKSVLSSAETWNLISFIRSFNKNYQQKVMAVITSSAYPGSVIKMLLSFNSAGKTFIVKASAEKEGRKEPVTGAEIKILVHRTFGFLPVDDIKSTDKDGVAIFAVPSDMPGDTAGNVLVSARFVNEEIFGSVSKDTLLNAGTKTSPVSLVARRAMWNNVRKAPIWILLTYSVSLLVAWGFILFVLMKIRDIFIIGESVNKEISPEENK